MTALACVLLAAASSAAAPAPRPGASAPELIRSGRYAEAEKVLERAARASRDPRVYKDLMWAAWRAGDADGAARAAERALALAPRDLEARNLLAGALLAQGRAREAFSAYLRSDELSPGQAPVLRALCALRERFRSYREALASCDAAAAAGPADASLAARRGELLFLLGRYAESADSYRRAAELSSGATSYALAEARSLHWAGRPADAVAILRARVEADPRDSRALELAVQIGAVTGRLDWSVGVLERAAGRALPREEDRRLALAELQRRQGRPDAAEATLRAAVAANPESGAALRALGELLDDLGRRPEAVALFERLTRLNPTSSVAWARLAEDLDTAGRPADGLAAMRRARAQDPTDPYLLIAEARLLWENGRPADAEAGLKGWLAANTEEVLPVLLYHGLAERGDDPMLANEVHVTAAAFRGQMTALKRAGFRPVTAAQAAAWAAGRGSLPPRPVLITFDDARLDGFRPADRVLRELGLKATMFAPLSNVEPGLPGFADWDELEAYQSTGRWEIQAHGDLGHTYVARDAQGRPGRFLTNRRWLDADGRLETVAEWEARVAGDHAGSKRKIAERLGRAPVAFAFPEGEYGQAEAPNVPDASGRGLALCRRAYALCFQQDSRGLNARSRDRGRFTRLEPRRDWTGERLVRHISDQSPFVQVRRALLHQLAWTGRTHEAERLLELNRRAGASEALLLADQARVQWAAGDRPGGLELARRAYALEPSEENRLVLVDFERPERPAWRPSFQYFDDNKERRALQFRQTLGAWATRAGAVEVSHLRSSYREPGAPDVTDDGGGIQLTRTFGRDLELSAAAEGHFLGSGAPDTFTLEGRGVRRWTDSVQTTAEAGHRPYETARSLLAGVRERFVDATASFAPPDGAVRADLRAKAASLTDGNARAAASLEASRALPVPGLRAAARVTTDGVRFVSPAYYSPLHLRMYQAGLEWDGAPRPWLTAGVSYLPGYAREGGSPGSFAHELEASLKARRRGLSLSPSFGWTRTPSYRSTSLGLALELIF